MKRFDDDMDGEPVAVVRVFGDFAMTLSVTLILLVGTHAVPPSNEAVQTQPAVQQAGATNTVDLTLAVTREGRFIALPEDPSALPMDATSVARQWFATNKRPPVAVAVQFQSAMRSGDLHKALLQLQSSIGPTVNIRTYPAL